MELSREELATIYEMMGHPGWKLVEEQIESTLGDAVMSLLGLGFSDAGGSFDNRAAYWKGKVDAYWSMANYQNLIRGALQKDIQSDVDEQMADQGGVIRRLVSRLLGKGKE